VVSRKDSPGGKPTRTCPKCTDRLNERPLQESGIKVDACPVCHGLWFDHWELEGHLGTLCTEIVPSADAAVTDRRCPGCRIAMTTFTVPGSQVVIDLCEECKGIWLDAGELKRLESFARPPRGFLGALRKLLAL
jgi:Zn-finger nucleic acid-binding protein